MRSLLLLSALATLMIACGPGTAPEDDSGAPTSSAAAGSAGEGSDNSTADSNGASSVCNYGFYDGCGYGRSYGERCAVLDTSDIPVDSEYAACYIEGAADCYAVAFSIACTD